MLTTAVEFEQRNKKVNRQMRRKNHLLKPDNVDIKLPPLPPGLIPSPQGNKEQRFVISDDHHGNVDSSNNDSTEETIIITVTAPQ